MSEAQAGSAQAPRKRCLVAWAGPPRQFLLELEADAGASVADLLASARERLGEGAAPWDEATVGIWGEVCARAAVPREGDRIELYRRLNVDPREARRTRARRRSGG